jgi:hypothetical protein
MAKKKTKKVTPKPAPAKKSKSLFELHPNLKWLLPLFFIMAIGFIFVAKHRINDEDNGIDKSAIIKQEIKQEILNHAANDDQVASPTAVPNQDSAEF